MERTFIEELQLLIQSTHKYSAEEFSSRAHETLLRAYALIESLEGAVEEKNSLIKKYSKAEEAFLQRIKKIAESERAAYERLADIDISRHVEVADLKQEIDKLKTEKGIPGSKELDALKREMEIKKLQLQESEKNLVALAETLREFRSEHERLREKFSLSENKTNEASQLREALKAIQDENVSLKKELSNLNELLAQKEKEITARPIPGQDEKIDNLNDECTIREKDISDLKEQIDRLVSDKDELVFNLSDSEKETALIKQENEELLKKTSDLSAEIRKLSEEKENGVSRCSKLEREISTISAVIEEKKKTIASRDEEIEKIRNLLSAEIQRHESEIGSLREESGSLASAVEEKEKMIAARDGEIEKIKHIYDAEVQRYVSVIEGLKSENNSIRNNLSEISRQAEIEASANLSALKELSGERDSLAEKLKKAGEEASAARNENSRLQKNFSDTIKELSQIKSQGQVSEEIISAQEITSGKLSDILKKLEDSIISNQSLAEKLEQISVQRVELQYPMVIEKKEVPENKKTTRLRPLTVTLIIMLMLSAGMFSAYKFRDSLLRAWSAILENTSAMVSQKPEAPVVPAGPWSGTREVATENFNAAVTLLDSEMMADYEIPPRITEEEKLKNNFYVLEINAKNNCIPADFINEPHKRISILNKDGAELDVNKIKSLDLLKKAFYKNNACDGDTGAVFLRYFMAVNKDQFLKGIMIDGLVENEPITIK